jgi:hypothetical protein
LTGLTKSGRIKLYSPVCGDLLHFLFIYGILAKKILVPVSFQNERDEIKLAMLRSVQ